MKTIVVAGGCFWGVEEYYRRCKGIESTKVGYAQSKMVSPKYEEVKMGSTEAVEAVLLEYDENMISLEKILEHLFRMIDPTSLNRQKDDIGTQYRTGVYYSNEEDKSLIEEYIIEEQKNYNQAIVVENNKLENFYDAEEYHQLYLVKNPSGYCHIDFSLLKENETKD